MRPVSVLLLLSLSAAVVVINAYSVPKPAPCPKNMTREFDCIPCPEYCDKKMNKICTRICKPPTECYCKRGYVYDNMNKCVLPKDCPKK